MIEYQDLMNQVHGVIKENPRYLVKSQYNIFDVLGVKGKEVIMCRYLADLLNPQGAHCLGNLFIKSFFDQVLEIHDVSDSLLEQTEIITEYPIESQEGKDSVKRIDIVICNSHYFIPIEVKIYADDQNKQCVDYYKYAEKVEPSTKEC